MWMVSTGTPHGPWRAFSLGCEMDRRHRLRLLGLGLVLVLAVTGLANGSRPTSRAEAEPPPTMVTLPVATDVRLRPGPDANLVMANCTLCHTLKPIITHDGFTPAQWADEVQKMRDDVRGTGRRADGGADYSLPPEVLRQSPAVGRGLPARQRGYAGRDTGGWSGLKERLVPFAVCARLSYRVATPSQPHSPARMRSLLTSPAATRARRNGSCARRGCRRSARPPGRSASSPARERMTQGGPST